MRENSVRGPAIDLGEFERRLRAPERKETGGDPLGELARLIQGEEAAADPYSRILGEPQPLRPSAHDDDMALRGSYQDANEAHYSEAQYQEHAYVEPTIDHDQAYEAQRYASRDESPAPQQDYRGAEGGWNDDAQYLDYGEEQLEPFDEAEGQRSWFRPWHAVAGISLLAIASIGWGFAHRGGGESAKEIATITAPEGPVKVKPTAETEAAAPDTGGAAVLDRKENEPVKQVVTNQEQAVEPTVAPNAATPGLPPAPAITAPKKVKTVTVRPDGTRVDDAEGLPPAVSRAARAPETEAPPAPPPAAAAPPAAKPAPKPVAKPKAPPKPAPKVAAVPPAEEAAPAEAAPADDGAAPTAPAPVTKGGYAVQFGAATTEAEASALVKSVSSKYVASLGGHRPSFAKATVGDKTVYRVRVGGVSKESAAAICGKVKASGGNCFIAGN